MNQTPEKKFPFELPYKRAWNIGLRTVHIAVSGVLVGGHVFDVSRTALLPWLYAIVVSGVLLAIVEAYPRFDWVHQGRGVLVLFKLILLGAIPWLWSYRVPVLFVIVAVASVGSHMPARFRYYSIVHRRMMK